jgi:PleD family two-component response regulator
MKKITDLSILVMNSDENLQKKVKETLDNLGVKEYVSVNNAEKALDKLKRKNYDVIILATRYNSIQDGETVARNQFYKKTTRKHNPLLLGISDDIRDEMKWDQTNLPVHFINPYEFKKDISGYIKELSKIIS